MCGPIPNIAQLLRDSPVRIRNGLSLLLLQVARLRQFLEEVRFEVLHEVPNLREPLAQFLEGDEPANLREARI